ncbi:AaceriAAL159Cp [[Ashbya] aceris (nom. inval.)]|nr:AaceriAAL159Cp [[Ashbya] aceris (nom. inval.)]
MSGISGSARKVFETPMRPISREQFQSMREKAVKLSPELYRTRILSDPTVNKFPLRAQGALAANVFERGESQPIEAVTPPVTQVSAVPVAAQDDDLLPEQEVATATGMAAGMRMETVSGSCDPSSAKPLGNYENPALAAFTRRVVNKEQEIKRIIANVWTLLIWNLVYKFLGLFLHSCRTGRFIYQTISHFFYANVVFKLNPHARLDSGWLRFWTLEHINHLIHMMLLINIALSLYMLLVKAQHITVSDLGLNERQKELLGVSASGDTQSSIIEDAVNPRPLLHRVSSKGSVTEHILPSDAAQPQPFLFKSLQTPLRSSKGQPSSTALQSELPYTGRAREHLFPAASPLLSQKLAAPAVPANRPGSGYIPSSKYAYMMDSPSARKRL